MHVFAKNRGFLARTQIGITLISVFQTPEEIVSFGHYAEHFAGVIHGRGQDAGQSGEFCFVDKRRFSRDPFMRIRAWIRWRSNRQEQEFRRLLQWREW